MSLRHKEWPGSAVVLRPVMMTVPPAATCTHLVCNRIGGTLHCPELLLPQATTRPSERRAIECEYPPAAATYWTPAGSTGTLHCPEVLSPRATKVPSSRTASTWL